MPGHTRWKWKGAWMGAAALALACQHPRYEERGVGGAGQEAGPQGDTPHWDRRQEGVREGVIDQPAARPAAQPRPVPRGIDPTRDSRIFPPRREDPTVLPPREGGGPSGSSNLGEPGDFDSPYTRLPEVSEDALQQRRDKVNPNVNPNATQRKQPYLDPFNNRENPASVGGSAGGGGGGP